MKNIGSFYFIFELLRYMLRKYSLLSTQALRIHHLLIDASCSYQLVMLTLLYNLPLVKNKYSVRSLD
jgi:hypothetical protein